MTLCHVRHSHHDDHTKQTTGDFTTVRGGSFMRKTYIVELCTSETNVTLIMRILPKYATFLLQVLYFLGATQATVVQNDTERKKHRESYFTKIQTVRQVVGTAGEESKLRPT